MSSMAASGFGKEVSASCFNTKLEHKSHTVLEGSFHSSSITIFSRIIKTLIIWWRLNVSIVKEIQSIDWRRRNKGRGKWGRDNIFCLHFETYPSQHHQHKYSHMVFFHWYLIPAKTSCYFYFQKWKRGVIFSKFL